MRNRLTIEKLESRLALSGIGFAVKDIISDDIAGLRSVIAADIDGDGDKDVSSASAIDGKVLLFKNDGSAVFGSPTVINSRALGLTQLLAHDLDADGDLDLVTTRYGSDENIISWYENVDGLGQFGGERTLDGGQYWHVWIADVDGDRDDDLISDRSWLENLGHGRFDHRETEFSQVRTVGDLDSDGDVDVLVRQTSNLQQGTLVRNLDGTGNFGDPIQIVTGSHGSSTLVFYPADRDADGDLDLLVADNSKGGSKIASMDSGTLGPHKSSVQSFPPL